MMTTDASTTSLSTPVRVLVLILCLLVAAALGWAVWSVTGETAGLAPQVTARLDQSGVNNPVTAVLLNFRAYDTLLEIAVLFLALLGSWSIAPLVNGAPVTQPPEAALTALVHLLLPVIVLVAGYLLWVGAYAPGGAFQAGSVLAAAGVLLVLTWPSGARHIGGWPVRGLLTLGLGMVLAVALGVMAGTGRLLQYPTGLAGPLILLIETAAMLSIGATLSALFIGGRPQDSHHSASQEDDKGLPT